MKLTILYRGPLRSCNFGCSYCPLAKGPDPLAELAADRRALERFVGWIARQRQLRLAVFFTPRGEALIRPWYAEALVELSRLEQVERVAFQTNLSARPDWVRRCRPERVGIWATYHPGWIHRSRFVARCRELHHSGVSLSAGMVGLRRHFAEIEALRRELPRTVYLWVNAYKRDPAYYEPAEVARLAAVDPLVRFNLRPHPSRGLACRAGHDVLAVDGEGCVRRCLFLDRELGNLYRPGTLQRDPHPRPCTNDSCGCHIGYVHMPHLGLDRVFGEGVLERVPRHF